MPREFIWRRRTEDISNLYDGYANDTVNGEWVTYWIKVCELVQGETLTRTLVDAQFHRIVGPSDTSSVLYHTQCIVGMYVDGDATRDPVINPWVHKGYQDWLWWQGKSYDRLDVQPWSSDYQQSVRFTADIHAQRKAKDYAVPHSVLWFMWACRWGSPFTQANWELSSVSASAGILLP